jgi:hypothetical protein
MNYFIGVAQNVHFSRVVRPLARLQIAADLVSLAIFITFEAIADAQHRCMCGRPSPSGAS